jgi:hypothetical protein
MPASASSYRVRVPEDPSAGPLRRPVRLLLWGLFGIGHLDSPVFASVISFAGPALPFYLSCLSAEPAIRSPRHLLSSFLTSTRNLSEFVVHCLLFGSDWWLIFPVLIVWPRSASYVHLTSRPLPFRLIRQSICASRTLYARITHPISQSCMGYELVCATDTGR